DAVLFAATRGGAMIQSEQMQTTEARRGEVRLGVRIPPGSLIGYAIMGLLVLLYGIPMVFVLFVAVESNTQFMTNAAAFPSPILWSNFPDAWIQGTFGSYF